jgi:hypothetical protein
MNFVSLLTSVEMLLSLYADYAAVIGMGIASLSGFGLIYKGDSGALAYK